MIDVDYRIQLYHTISIILFLVRIFHKKSVECELSFYDKKLGRTIVATEIGYNGQMASKYCALSFVRQLYHLQAIKAYTKKTDTKKLEPYDVQIDQQLMADISNFLEEIDVLPVEVPENYNGEEAIPLTLKKHIKMEKAEQPQYSGGVSWSPPHPNWNPWTSCNIDEGPLATMTLPSVSASLKNEYDNRIQNNASLQKMLKSRKELPIYQFRDQILDAVQNNNTVIIRSATGCGKTTQVPQYILDYYLDAGCGADCSIVVTQPHCFSAVSIAERIAKERSECLGNTTGYSVRFESCLPRPYGSILFCTVSVLLRKLESGLRGVSHIVVDEIHERDVNTDFIMVVLRDMVRAFPQIHIVLMSATIDTSLFQEYFGNCPIIEVSGRTFPVQEYFLEDCIQLVNFVPPLDTRKRKGRRKQVAENEEIDEDMNKVIGPGYSPSTKSAMSKLWETELPFELIEALLKYIKRLNVPGTVLVFLPDWNLIFSLTRHLSQHPVFGQHDYCILPLHSYVPREIQHKVFEPVPFGVTKIILATNIAETSIAINDVVYVIDSCKAKMKLFTSHNNIAYSATAWTSKTNLEQRKERAGQVRPGFVFRLCSRARFEKLDNCTTPEIFRTPLHEIALAIKLLRLGDIGKFLSKALEPPHTDAVTESEVFLRELGALDGCSELTPLGKIIARLPIEPRLGKMLVLACIFHFGEPLCIMAAHSSTFPELVDTPFPKRRDDVLRIFRGDRWSDHLTMLNAFMQWEDKHMAGENAEQSFCENFSLNLSSLRITHDARNKLRDFLTTAEFPEACLAHQSFNFDGGDPKLDMVTALLCMGFYPNVCFYEEKRSVITIDGKTALMEKASVNSSNLPAKFPSPFFVYGEKFHTRIVGCKQMTMVTPLHLLLFGCKNVECIKGHIFVDGWINFRMSPQDAARIVALHSVIEDFIMEVADNPKVLADPGPRNCKLIELIRKLCNLEAGKFGSEKDRQEASAANAGFFGGPPRKTMRFSDSTQRISSSKGFSADRCFTRGSSYGSRGGGFQGRGGGGYGNRGGYGNQNSNYGGGGYGNQGSNYGGRGGGNSNQSINYGGQGSSYGNQGGNYGEQSDGFGSQGNNYVGSGGGYGNQGANYGGRGGGYRNQCSGRFDRSGRNNYGDRSTFNARSSGSGNYGDQGVWF